MLSAGIVIGIMIIPYVSSLSEDAMKAVPVHIREGSYAMGATRFQTAVRVLIPSAFSGIASAYVLGFSRAVGETMVVAIAAGQQPNLTLNPMEGAATITAYIVQVSLGDLPHGSIAYQSIFAAGLTLMCMTLIFNIGGYLLRKTIQGDLLRWSTRCDRRQSRRATNDSTTSSPSSGCSATFVGMITLAALIVRSEQRRRRALTPHFFTVVSVAIRRPERGFYPRGSAPA